MRKIFVSTAVALSLSVSVAMAQAPAPAIASDPAVTALNNEYQALVLQLQHFAAVVSSQVTTSQSALAQYQNALANAEKEKETLIQWLQEAKSKNPPADAKTP